MYRWLADKAEGSVQSKYLITRMLKIACRLVCWYREPNCALVVACAVCRRILGDSAQIGLSVYRSFSRQRSPLAAGESFAKWTLLTFDALKRSTIQPLITIQPHNHSTTQPLIFMHSNHYVSDVLAIVWVNTYARQTTVVLRTMNNP